MLMVARPFTSLGKFYNAGDVLADISSIRNGRLKVSEGKLFIVDKLREQTTRMKIAKISYHTGIPMEELLIRSGLEKAVEVPGEDIVVPEVAPVTPEPTPAPAPIAAKARTARAPVGVKPAAKAQAPKAISVKPLTK